MLNRRIYRGLCQHNNRDIQKINKPTTMRTITYITTTTTTAQINRRNPRSDFEFGLGILTLWSRRDRSGAQSVEFFKSREALFNHDHQTLHQAFLFRTNFLCRPRLEAAKVSLSIRRKYKSRRQKFFFSSTCSYFCKWQPKKQSWLLRLLLFGGDGNKTAVCFLYWQVVMWKWKMDFWLIHRFSAENVKRASGIHMDRVSFSVKTNTSR